jgi:branched-chain amino acid transport system permease protein
VGRLLQTLTIGLIQGCLYALIAMGMVLVYRSTGVLNIAHGGVGVFAGFCAWDLIVKQGWPYYLGVAAGVTIAVIVGLIFEWAIIKRLPNAALKTVATLGLFLVLQGIVFVIPRWGNTWGQLFPSPLQGNRVRIPGTDDFYISADQIVLVSAVVLFLVGLYFILRRTRIGLAMRAVSDDPTAARLMGVRDRLVSPVVWGLSFGISGLTTMLVAPILFLDNTTIVALTLKALTVTFIGGLVSLPLTVLGALLLAVLESGTLIYMPRTASEYGLADAWPFILMIVVLMVRFARGTKALEEQTLATA